MKSTVGWGYEGYGAKTRDGNGPREVEVASWGKRLIRISTKTTNVKRIVVVVVVV